MFRSEGCHSCRGVDCDYKIPDPTNKTSWRTQVRKWKTYKDPKDYQTGQSLAWSLDTIIQGAKKRQMNWQNGQEKVPNCKQHAATKEPTKLLTDDKDYFKVIAEARLTLETRCSCCAMHWEEKSRQTSGNWSHWGTGRFRKDRSMRNSEATTYGPHRRKKEMWGVFTVAWYTSQFFMKKLWKIPEAKAAVDK